MRSRKLAAFLVLVMATTGLGTTTATAATIDQTVSAIRENHLPDSLGDLEISTQNQIICLALNQYHEARGSTEADIKAVGFSTRNRVQKKGRDYCDIIWERLCARCAPQYVWTGRDVSGIIPKEKASWSRMIDYARQIVTNDELADPTGGADSFFSRKIKMPEWAKRSPFQTPIGAHIYVRMIR